MIRKYLIPLLAVVGMGFAVWMVANQSRPAPAAEPVAMPAQAPFASYVAGSAIIETSTENIAIGAVTPGIVTDMYVKPGTIVKAGAPLFKVDDRALKAELAVRQAALSLSKEKLAKLIAQPRLEDLPPAEAKVQEAEATLADLRNQLALYDSVSDKRAVSEDELSKRRFAVRAAEARLTQFQATLTQLKAGAWKPDIEIARAEIASAQAQIRAIETDIERLTTRAPVDGAVLQVKIRLGEYAPSGVTQTPLVLMGGVDRYHVRVDIDENDAWRIKPGATAVAFVRGNREIKTAIQFVRVEPYVVPKKSLTGDSTERVDTRVLQLIYSFQRGDMPVYIGQQMDVFIEAPPVGPTTQALSAPTREGPTTKSLP
jgi:HlyD family secretion protein